MSLAALIIVTYVLTARITRVVLGALFRLVTVVVAVLVALALVTPKRVAGRVMRATPVANAPSDYVGAAPR